MANASALRIGSGGGVVNFFSGSIQEVALYNTVLSADRIKAHYNARYANCLSQTTFNANTWYNVQGIMDGSTASLFVNGQQECATAMPNALTPSTTLAAGGTSSGTKGWTGSVADIKIYGTSDGSSVGTSSTVLSNYLATANRYPNDTAYVLTSGSSITVPSGKTSVKIWVIGGGGGGAGTTNDDFVSGGGGGAGGVAYKT